MLHLLNCPKGASSKIPRIAQCVLGRRRIRRPGLSRSSLRIQQNDLGVELAAIAAILDGKLESGVEEHGNVCRPATSGFPPRDIRTTPGSSIAAWRGTRRFARSGHGSGATPWKRCGSPRGCPPGRFLCRRRQKTRPRPAAGRGTWRSMAQDRRYGSRKAILGVLEDRLKIRSQRPRHWGKSRGGVKNSLVGVLRNHTDPLLRLLLRQSGEHRQRCASASSVRGLLPDGIQVLLILFAERSVAEALFRLLPTVLAGDFQHDDSSLLVIAD